MSYHGDVTNALRNYRASQKRRNEVIFNTPLIDLGVRHSGMITEIYEVKTGADRSEIYSAVGQLMVHSAGAKITKKTVVLPAAEALPYGTHEILSKLGVEILRYEIRKRGVVEFR